MSKPKLELREQKWRLISQTKKVKKTFRKKKRMALRGVGEGEGGSPKRPGSKANVVGVWDVSVNVSCKKVDYGANRAGLRPLASDS